jgi:hypothetical protein
VSVATGHALLLVSLLSGTGGGIFCLVPHQSLTRLRERKKEPRALIRGVEMKLRRCVICKILGLGRRRRNAEFSGCQIILRSLDPQVGADDSRCSAVSLSADLRSTVSPMWPSS